MSNKHSQTASAPVAPARPKTLEHHGERRLDPFYWMREKDHQDLLAYLKAENGYTDKVMAHFKGEEEQLYQEILGRIKETDMSVPYTFGNYRYYTRTEQGLNYPVYCRKVNTSGSREEILLNANQLSQAYAYYHISGMRISDNEKILAFGEDTTGDFFFTLRFRNLEEGTFLKDQIEEVAAFAWAADNQTIFYAKIDAAKRPYRIYRHRLGDAPSADAMVYEEQDETFRAYVYRSRSRDYLIIGSSSNISDEYHLIPANQPSRQPMRFEAREKHHEFSLDHGTDGFYMVTNWKARNYRLMFCPTGQRGRQYWQVLQEHNPDVLLEGIQIFRSFYALEERRDGLTQIKIRRLGDDKPEYIRFSEEAYSAGIGANPEFDSPGLRYHYSSFTTPGSVYAFNTESGVSELLKQQEVPSGHDPQAYESRRIWATAPDQTRVPVSIVYKKSLFQGNGQNPALLMGYGSYGITNDAYFSPVKLSLLDRGFIVAQAHVRGGMDLGRAWYDQGKLLHKKNTFSDFIACAEKLIEDGFTSSQRLAAQGGSAGGMLMGVVANERPDLFQAIIMDVPFVDVLTTMLDTSIPLTTNEFDEWGNPEDETYYHYIKSYSPYDNIKEQDYPHMLVVTAYNDANVQYWEPTKWVAKLRETKTDQHYLLYRIDMESGHAGPSGRYAAIRERAFEYSFLTGLLGMGLSPKEEV